MNTLEHMVLLSPRQRAIDSHSWSPDGKWIDIRTFGATPETKYQGEIILVATDGSQRVIEVNAKGPVFPVHLDWSPVDNRLVVTSLDGIGSYSLHLLDLTPWLEESDDAPVSK